MDMITTKEAANILGVTASRIRQMIRDGLLPAQKLGRDNLIDPDHLKTLPAKHKPGPKPKPKTQ